MVNGKSIGNRFIQKLPPKELQVVLLEKLEETIKTKNKKSQKYYKNDYLELVVLYDIIGSKTEENLLILYKISFINLIGESDFDKIYLITSIQEKTWSIPLIKNFYI
jgi:hypothetical protein